MIDRIEEIYTGTLEVVKGCLFSAPTVNELSDGHNLFLWNDMFSFVIMISDSDLKN